MFDDVVEANRSYSETFDLQEVAARPRRSLAVVTCMDSRIEPMAALGLEPGDAKIIRNAGARVTEDVMRSLVLGVNLLHVRRVCVIQHTDCAVARSTNDELKETIGGLRQTDTSDWDFLAIDDQENVLASDIERIRGCPLLPPDLTVGGFIYDVQTGRLQEVAC